jgi:sugar phosphate isomerase/epimerase
MLLAAAGMIPHEPGAAAPALARLRGLGLDGASWHLPSLAAAAPAALRELRARFADAGLAVAQLLPPPYESLVDPDPARRQAGLETLARCGEAARQLDAPTLYVRPGSMNPAGPWTPHPENHRPEVCARLLESLVTAARRAAEQGVTLALEGHVVSPVATPAIAGELLATVASPALRFNLDVVNFLGTLDDAYDPSGVQSQLLAQTAPWVAAVHLKDVTVEERLVVHIAETVPGRGTLDLAALLRACRVACPGAWVIIEHLAAADLPEAVAAVRRAAGG